LYFSLSVLYAGSKHTTKLSITVVSGKSQESKNSTGLSQKEEGLFSMFLQSTEVYGGI
jgi:hypothetical protein